MEFKCFVWDGLKQSRFCNVLPIPAVLSCAPDQVQYVTCKRLSSADVEARAKAWQVGLKAGGPSEQSMGLTCEFSLARYEIVVF